MSASGSYLGYSASLSVDVSKFRESMTKGTSFGENKKVFTSGGDNLPEPIALKLLPISRAFDASFYATLDQKFKCDKSQRKSNVLQLFKKYPGLRNAKKPQGIIKYSKIFSRATLINAIQNTQHFATNFRKVYYFRRAFYRRLIYPFTTNNRDNIFCDCDKITIRRRGGIFIFTRENIWRTTDCSNPAGKKAITSLALPSIASFF